MKHIAVFTHAAGSPYHGPNLRWYYLGRSLRLLGWKVTIVGASEFHKYHCPPKSIFGSGATVDGVGFRWLTSLRYRSRGIGQIINQFSYVVSAWLSRIPEFEDSPDVVIASSPHPLVVFPAVRYARKFGVPFVYEVRDLWPRAISELGGFAWWNPYILLLKFAERYAIRSAALVISVKEGDIEYFESEYKLDRNRFLWLPNGFYSDKEGVGPEVSQFLLGESLGWVVGYVGALSAYYGIDDLLDAAKIIGPDAGVSFVVVGGGDDEYRLRERVKNEGLGTVHFVGRQPKSSIEGWLAGFDVCYIGLKDVSVNDYGISCNKLFEYMASSRPVVASYKSRYDPIERSGCGVTVPPGNPHLLADAITKIKQDKELAKEMGKRGKIYFDQHHDFSVISRWLDDALRRCLK